MNNNLINSIIEQLKNYTNNDCIDYLKHSRSSWVNDAVLQKCQLLSSELPNFHNISTAFEKDVYLKFVVNKIYKENQKQLDEWIVKDWGGISTHKNFETLYKSKELKKFDRISSWSKLLSFENIEEDIIYDSRVIYSLNWLIYKYNKSYDAQEQYLFQPDGRNKRLSLLSVNSIIYFDNATKLDENKRGDNIYSEIFISKNRCYAYAKEMLKQINQALYKDVNISILETSIEVYKYPFFTEMLLFELADKEVFRDIKCSVQVSIVKQT